MCLYGPHGCEHTQARDNGYFSLLKAHSLRYCEISCKAPFRAHMNRLGGQGSATSVSFRLAVHWKGQFRMVLPGGPWQHAPVPGG
eukprot:3192458-Amphidinium_carterae.2